MKQKFPPFSERESFPVCMTLKVQWGEMDSFSHVNNIIYFRYFETARIAYFEKMDILQDNIGPILAKTDCSFLAPLTFPDTIYVVSHVCDVQEDRFVMRYGIYSAKKQRLMAKGSGTIVPYDYTQKIKATLPSKWKRSIFRLES